MGSEREFRVTGLGGTLCVITAGDEATVWEAKLAAEAATGIPACEQRLFAAAGELRFPEVLLRDVVGDGPSEQCIKHPIHGVNADSDLVLVRREPEQLQWLRRVEAEWWALEEAPIHIRADAEVVLTAMKHGRHGFHFAADDLRADRDVVLAVVRQNGLMLQAASDALRVDRDVVLAAVRQHGLALRYAAHELRSDKEIVLAAVEREGSALEFASDTLRGDPDVVRAALQHDRKFPQGPVLRHVVGNLPDDRDVAIAAILQDGSALEFLPMPWRNDRDVVLAAVQRYGYALEYASEVLRADREVVMAAVAEGGTALRYASQELRADRDVVLAAIDQDGTALEFASDDLRADSEVALAALESDPAAWRHIAPSLRKRRSFQRSVGTS